MSEYILSCCSTVDLSVDYMGERNIHYLPFHFELDEVLYADDVGKSIPLKEFYRKMKDGAMPRTSQINVTEYEEYFEAFLKDGKDILHITASSGLSGTYNSAMIAARDLQEKYNEVSQKMNEVFYKDFSEKEVLELDRFLDRILENLDQSERSARKGKEE